MRKMANFKKIPLHKAFGDGGELPDVLFVHTKGVDDYYDKLPPEYQHYSTFYCLTKSGLKESPKKDSVFKIEVLHVDTGITLCLDEKTKVLVPK